MSFPPSLTTRTVTGRFVTYPNGVGAKGTVRIVLKDPMQGPTDDAIVAPFDILLDLDSNGAFSALLPATDDPQWTSSVYRFIITLGMNSTIRAMVFVPSAGSGPLDLTDLINLPAPTPGEQYILAASKGAPGGIASLGSDGKLLSSQMPVVSVGNVDWDNVTDKPSTFPHDPISFADLTDKPSVYPADPPTFSAVTGKPASYPSLWSDVADKPATFAPSAHDHLTSEVTGLDTALAAKATTAALTSGLAGKANTTHPHVMSDVTGLTDAMSLKADLVNGVLATSQVPELAVVRFMGSVANEAAMLTQTGQSGDWVIRSDVGQSYVITGPTPSQLSSWTPLPLGVSPVQMVNGQVGTVVLGKTDIGLGNVDNTSDANKPLSNADVTALAAKAPIASPTFTGTPAAPTASPGTNTTQVATTAFVTAADNLKAAGAASSVDGGIALFSGTGGKTLKTTGVTIDSNADFTGIRRLSRTLGADPAVLGLDRIDLNYTPTTTTSDLERIYVNAVLTTWRNEVGFLRGTPHSGYKDDALLRAIPRSDLTAETGGFVELQNSARTQILYKRDWLTGALWRGNGSSAAVKMADTLVLSAAAAVPAGTPPNTVIVRTAT